MTEPTAARPSAAPLPPGDANRMIATFEKLLASGKDTALLRFGLGNEFLKGARAADAIPHLRRAVELDPAYSAAWKLLGKALAGTGAAADALAAYQQGIDAAAAHGDQQAVKEMTVFARRIERQQGGGGK